MNTNVGLDSTLCNLATLESAGGRYWEQGDKRRVYFNDLAGLYGLEFERYRSSGRISWARLNGEVISNSKGERLAAVLDPRYAKLFVDLNANAIYATNVSDEISEALISALMAKLAQVAQDSSLSH